MDKILNDLTDYSWWFGVVIVGIVLNLGTSYLKPTIDNILAKYSSRKREQLGIAKKRQDEAIKLLNTSQEERMMLKFRIIEHQTAGNHSLILGLSFFIMTFSVIGLVDKTSSEKYFIVVLLLFSVYCLLESFYLRARARYLMGLLNKTNFPNRW